MEKEILSVVDEMQKQIKAITVCLENDEPVKYIRYTNDGTVTVTIEKEDA